MKITRDGIRHFLSCAGFLLVTGVLFVLCTYLFRPTGRFSRGNIIPFYSEEKDTLDVMVVGASGTYRYYSPLAAWHEQGYTSYTYAAGSMQGSLLITALKDIEKTQSPRLYLIDARRFLTEHLAEKIGPAFQRYADALDVDVNRFNGIRYFCSLHDISPEESIISYLDLIQYHDNYPAMISQKNWSMILNRTGSKSAAKGFHMVGKVRPFEPDPAAQTQNEAWQSEKAESVYLDFLNYCQENSIPILLVATPYLCTESDMEEFNMMQRIADSYGYDFVNLNTSQAYEELGINFTTDFYNPGHMNVNGAEKYTAYIAAYIRSHYDIPDHRGETGYEDWDNGYQQYAEKVKKAQAEIEKSLNAA